MKKLPLVMLILVPALVLICGCTQGPAAPPSAAPATTPQESMTMEITVQATGMPGYKDITPAEAKALIEREPRLVIIDVSPYYANGHLPGAVSIPLAMLDAKIPSLDRTKPYLVYCHGDSPSIAGARKLSDAGFSPVYRLQGNYAAWVAAGYPVEK